MPNEPPDFRKMTPDEIRVGMNKLNLEIRELKRLQKLSPEFGFFLDELETERRKYKEVWRARPGRVFHDVAARRVKEKQRKWARLKKNFPFIP